MPIDKLVDRGYLYLWAIKTKLKEGIKILEDWGFTLIDWVLWVKVDHQDPLEPAPILGRYNNFSCEACLVGSKGRPESMMMRQNLGIICDAILRPRDDTYSTKPLE
jgi:N6-adenosine-specific RNA methylase IME4